MKNKEPTMEVENEDLPQANEHGRTVWHSEERDLADLNLYTSLVNLIDVVAARGSVRGDELLSTGVLRENLISRLKEFEGMGFTNG